MTPHKDTNKGGSNKRSKYLTIAIVIPLIFIFILLGVGAYFVYQLFKSEWIYPEKQANNTDKIEIQKIPEQKEIDPEYFNSRDKFLSKYSKVDWTAEKLYKQYKKGDVSVIEYKDPINGLIFKDYSYGTYQEEPRFFLGFEGLAYLANQFYEKVTFGPEISSLKSINVNNFNVINDKANGLYLPQYNEIYLNGSFIAEKGFKLVPKVRHLIEVLFHEYQHHWATSYASYGSLDPNDPNTTNFVYSTNENDGRYSQWNTGFINNYLNNLNYGFDNLRNITNVPNNSITRVLTLNDIFELSNNKDKMQRQALLEYAKRVANSNDEVSFKAQKQWQLYTNVHYDYKLDQLTYYYSIDELVPREWQKYTYVPYYVQGITDKTINSKYAENLSYKGNLPYKDKTDQGFEISQNYYGSIITDLNNGYSYTTFSSYAADWTRTVENGSLNSSVVNKYNGKTDTIYNLNQNANSYSYPNSVWGLKYEYIVNSQYYRVAEFQDKHREFYKGFLDTMFYGKPFAQMKSKIALNSENKVISKYLNEYQITGYLPSSDFKYLVYKNKQSQVVKLPLNYLNYFNYNAKDDYLDGFRTLTPNKLDASEYNENYFAYYTPFFNTDNVDFNSPIYFYKGDLNANNSIDSDEIWADFTNKDVPNNRYLISSDYSYFQDYNFETKQLKLIGNKVYMKGGFY
ncbi:MYPU_1760 family metalloprotease [Mycoplasmopsis felifaucium]|uniref:Uncharacterized protein n=1 Tax=Mycoplasmopsis felifaucium TaxID=35768 RepID=A0ABZ2RQ12_9BACT